jgi:RHS repeat-associated protein
MASYRAPVSIFVLALVLFPVIPPPLPAEAAAQAGITRVRQSVKALNLANHAIPTITELMAAGQLGGQLYPTHEVRDLALEKKVNLSFGQAMDLWNRHEYDSAVKLFKEHVEQVPESPWVSEAALHIGCDAQYNGRYKEAGERFQWIIKKNKGKSHPGARALRNKARLRLGVLKVYENDFVGARELFEQLKEEGTDWRQRTYASHWLQRLCRYTADGRAMLDCGSRALAYLLERGGRRREAEEVAGLLPETFQGHSMKGLSDIAARYGYDLAAVQLSPEELKALPLPAIVRMGRAHGRGHYWVLEKIEGDTLGLLDPQSGRRFRQDLSAFSDEWGGQALFFFTGKALPGVRLAQSFVEASFGGCCGVPRAEDGLGASWRNFGPSSLPDHCTAGSPRWFVNMVNMNLYVKDVPLWYKSPIGPSVSISLSYNSQSAIAAHEPFGNKWSFNYGTYLVVDTGGNVTVFMPDGRRDIYTPDGSGGYVSPYLVFNRLVRIQENLFELRFPGDTVYVYDIPPGTASLQPFLVQIRDAHGERLSLGYNNEVQLSTITDASGKVSTLTYNADGLVTQVTDPFGRSAAFDYDDDRNLIGITDMGGYWCAMGYDEDSYVESIENERGRWGFYTELPGPRGGGGRYPPPGAKMWQGYRITITDPLGEREEYFYCGGGEGFGWYVSPRHYIAWESATINNDSAKTPKTTYEYSRVGQRGEIQKIVSPEGGTTAYEYDAAGNRTRITDPHGHSVSLTYNEMGRITSLMDARGRTTTFLYHENGVDLMALESGLGTMALTYNGTHDVTSFTDLLGNTTRITYNPYGQIASQIDALGVVTEYTCDEEQRLSRITKDGHMLNEMTYDFMNRVKTRTDATGLTLVHEYNDLDHITAVTYPDGRFVEYTYSGCCPRLLESVTDRAGRSTSYVYDARERLIEAINPEGGSIRYAYDADGELTLVVDPNQQATAFEYDPEGRLVKTTHPDGTAVSYAYDVAGLLTRRTNARGIKATYAYDENHNLTEIKYSDDTPGVNFEYDDYNRLTQRQDGTGTYRFTYDARSMITGVDGPWEGDALAYTYDALGLRTALAPEMGRSLAYTHDPLGRLTGIQAGEGAYAYTYVDANPLTAGLNRPNGSATRYEYDSLRRLIKMSNLGSSAALINAYAYTYNDRDLRSSETATNGEPITHLEGARTTYDYDEANKLLVTSAPEWVIAHDADGNLTQGYTPEGYRFKAEYDAENRLKALEYMDKGGVIHRSEYLYTGDWMLAEVREYENGAVFSDTRIVRDGFLALQEKDETNKITREYTWGLNLGGGIGGLLNLRQGGDDYAYLYDGKGNVTALVDGSQAVAATYAYGPFGQVMARGGTLDQPYQFSTKRYDDQTGLAYFGYRFYSPELGRWISRDPIGFAGGDVNLYGYVGNSPPNKVDPLGLADVGMAWWPSWPPDASQNWMTIDPILFYIGVGGVLGAIDLNWNSANPRLTSVSLTTPQLGGGFNLCITKSDTINTRCPEYGPEPSLIEQPFHYSFGSHYLGISFADNFDTICFNFGLVVGLMPVNVNSPSISF